MIAMVNHLAGHAAVDADVLTRDEASFVRTEVHHHVSDIHRVTDTAYWLLNGIGPVIDSIGSVNPTGGNAVHPHFSGKADGQRMGKSGNSSFGSSVALGLRLAHAVR